MVRHELFLKLRLWLPGLINSGVPKLAVSRRGNRSNGRFPPGGSVPARRRRGITRRGWV
ncbi:hypothetical protein HMPREF9154_0924 [Arachnia propionica F0230a]|nr:hypothetical protein HMPREF9154_0924 [Arachnia propionica F0230a]